MMEARPSTLEGFRAVARALAIEDLELLRPDAWRYDNTRLTALLVAGLTGAGWDGEQPPAPPAAPQQPDPDAELIRLCAEFCAIQRAWLAEQDAIPDLEWEAAVPRMDGRWEEVKVEQLPVLEALLPMQATTLRGVAALAEAMALWRTGDRMQDDPSAGTDERLYRATMRAALAVREVA